MVATAPSSMCWASTMSRSERPFSFVREQTPTNAIRSFLASLLQLGLLLAGTIIEGAVRGSLVHL